MGVRFINSFHFQQHRTLIVFLLKIKDVPFISISETTSAGGTLRRSWFDLQNGTLGSINSAHTAKIESYGNGWYRCSITFTATAGTYSILYYLSNGNNSTTAIVSTGLYIREHN